MGHEKMELDEESYIMKCFDSLLVDIRHADDTFPYTSIEAININYYDPPQKLLKDAIVSITPLRYITYQHENNAHFIPIYLTKKRKELIPYYSSMFVCSSRSAIYSLHSSKVKKIYLGPENSASAYLTPLWKLYDAGIIDEPTEKGVREKSIAIEKDLQHRDIVDKVSQDPNAIGATWNFDGWDRPSSERVRVIERFECIPQDPIIISANLKKYKMVLKHAIEKRLLSDPVFKTNFYKVFKISGIVPFSAEHQLAFETLYEKHYKQMHFNESDPMQKRQRMLFWLLMGINGLLVFYIFYLAKKYYHADNQKMKIRYSSYTWIVLTAFILVGIEIVRMFVEELLHNSFHDFSQYIIIAVGIVLASLSEFKNQFARLLSTLINMLIQYLQAISEIFKAPPADGF